MHIVKTSLPNKKIAKQMANKLISFSLAACVHYYPISSVFKWEGKICNEKEYILEAKTSKPREACKYIEKNHPYSCPMIYILSPNKVLEKYEKWVKK
ncbi:MAG: divalent cation tolerance protein CutA [Candidatus Micrarchaeota archaeon]